ncbi:MAG TPA: DEAD/DEAH box helicase [Pirellulales bacterium]|nr:DEAD/DEAH box helicase [Pirellulales bacterium]
MNHPAANSPAVHQASRALRVTSFSALSVTPPAVHGVPLVTKGAVELLSPPLALPRPGVLSPSIVSTGPAVRSFSFCLPAPPTGASNKKLFSPRVISRRAAWTSASARRATTSTRLLPPADVIKLSDRLRYVLQPSLETLLARPGAAGLDFPHHPFPYQMQGVAFLYPRVSAVLADEMGLGKTMQAITALRMLLHAGEICSVLIVCPKPLVTNWQRELAQWAPELPVAVIEGDQSRRAWQWQQAEPPVKIANYELLCRDAEIVARHSQPFDLVILDEAQRIKNRSGVTSEAVCSISRRRSWALTGTPVENSPDDLLGIFEFVAPGNLSGNMKPRSLGRAAGDYIIRRTKSQVLADLPPKLFRDADVDLSPEQRETYTLAEDEGVLRLTELGDAVTIQHVFELILRLKQICNFDPATGVSAKLERLAADLDEVAASGQKAIVFSQWVGAAQRLRGQLAHLHPLEYHGQISPRQRDAILEQFRADRRHHVLLMTYGAGGVGLNLQFCGYVFLFDRWWNPAVEDQAVNRAHRIGSAGPVTVTRFLARDTIEERIDQVLAEKRELFDTIFSDAARPHALGLTQQEIFGLFNLRCPTGTIDLSANPGAPGRRNAS